MKKVLLGSVVMISLTVGPALAQSQSAGPYGEIRGGVVLLSDSDIDQAGFPTSEISFDTGGVVEGALGYASGTGLRGEVALGYRTNDTDQLSDPVFGVFPIDGDVTALSLMANGYYDFNAGMPALHPFVGAGIGVAMIDIEASTFGVTLVNDDDTVFAYQAIAGVAYDFTPTVAGTLRYAYFATANPTFTDSTGVPFDAEYDSHAIMVGLLYTF